MRGIYQGSAVEFSPDYAETFQKLAQEGFKLASPNELPRGVTCGMPHELNKTFMVNAKGKIAVIDQNSGISYKLEST